MENSRARNRLLSLAITTALFAVSGNQAAAQDATRESRIETIDVFGSLEGYVVNRSSAATKTDVPLLETAQSLSIITADQIRIQNAESIAQAVKYTAGVHQLGSGDATTDGMVIRGFNATGTGLSYLNGTKFSRNIFSGVAEPYALERIEVLKGPASVLYGNAAPGGLINMVTKQPKTDAYHELKLQGGSFDRRQIAGDSTGALTDDGRWSYRLTGQVRRSDTMADHIPDDRNFGAASLRWQPSARTSFTLLSNFQDNGVGYHTGLPAEGTVLPNPNGRIDRERSVAEPGFDYFEAENYSIGYLFSHEFNDNITFRQNVLFYDAEADWRYVSTGSLDAEKRSVSRTPSWRLDDNTVWSIDNQLQVTWNMTNIEHTTLFGIDYVENDFSRRQYRGSAAPLDLYAPQYGTPVTLNAEASSHFNEYDEQLGVYLQEHAKIADRWVVTLGGRYDSQDGIYSDYRNPQLLGLYDYDPEEFSGRAGLVYLFDNGIAPYISYAESFQPAQGQDFYGNRFEPTHGEQTEIGLRYQPDNQALLITASLYTLTQTNVTTADLDNLGFTIQEGEVESQGFELEARANLSNDLSLVASYAYTDNEVSKSNHGNLGNRFGGVPKQMASLWLDYQFTNALDGLGLGAGVRYFGSSYNNANTLQVPGYSVFDAVLSYALATQWRLAVNVNNLFDKDYISTCTFSCYYGTERSAVATVTYNW